MTDYIIGGVLEYVTAVLGVQYDEVAYYVIRHSLFTSKMQI